MLASLRRDRDADHLAGTSLKDKQITDTDEVNGDRDAVLAGGTSARLNDTNFFADTRTSFTHDFFLLAVERMEETVSSTLNAAAERVIVTFVVVVTHFGTRGFFTDSLLGYRDLSCTSIGVRTFRGDVVGVSTVSCR